MCLTKNDMNKFAVFVSSRELKSWVYIEINATILIMPSMEKYRNSKKLVPIYPIGDNIKLQHWLK